MTAAGATRRTYLVECYSPGIEREEVESTAERAIAASAELRNEGCGVEYVGALLVPGDEVVFYVFASPCPGAVREASVRAAVPFERVVESVAVGPAERRPKGLWLGASD